MRIEHWALSIGQVSPSSFRSHRASVCSRTVAVIICPSGIKHHRPHHLLQGRKIFRASCQVSSPGTQIVARSYKELATSYKKSASSCKKLASSCQKLTFTYRKMRRSDKDTALPDKQTRLPRSRAQSRKCLTPPLQQIPAVQVSDVPLLG